MSDVRHQDMKSLSSGSAIAIGMFWVNLPILPLMFGPATWYLLWNLDANKHPSGAEMLTASALFAVGFVLAWGWWSLMVPQWRLWAWARVSDLRALKLNAVKAGLIWPEGHFFEKAEIRSDATRVRLRELEAGVRRDA